MKNQTELIKCSNKRILTAKGYKFTYRCVDILADQFNTNRYAPEFKELKNKLINLLISLIIDKGMTLEQIKDAIKNRTVNHGLLPLPQ